MTYDKACDLQSEAHAVGDLLVWTICEHPSDFPGLFTARPHSVRANAPYDFVMTHATLDGIRDMLPPGLTRLRRDISDDPVILECWI